MNLPNIDQLDDFLKQIDEIESVVKGLNSDDQNVVKECMEKADLLAKKNDNEIEVEGIKTKFGVSRSVINKYTEGDSDIPKNRDMSQAAFLSALEKDANERYERKKKNTVLANELKEKGNQEFKDKNYEKAIDYYTQALDKVRDLAPIYTNRAQAYNMIGKHEEAISDCNWALRIDEKCTKALIHKGKALICMKEFDKALTEFQNAKEIDSKQSEIIEGYIKELERSRLAHNQEEAVKIFLNENKNENTPANNILDILNNKINLKDQNVWYYSGGLRCLGSLCNDDTTRTLFRTQNGFSLFEEHSVFSSLLNVNVKLKKLNTGEIDVLCSIFEFFRLITKDCDENIRSIFKIKNFISIIESFIKQLNPSQKSTHISSFKFEIVEFLLNLSGNEFGLQQCMNNFKPLELLKNLLELVSYNNTDVLDLKVVDVVQNLVLEEKFQLKLLNENVQIVVDKICTILKEQSTISAKNLNLISKCLTVVYGLTSQKKFLKIIKDTEKVWVESVKFLTQVSTQKDKYEILSNVVICLLNNISAFKSEYLDSNYKKIIENVIKQNGYKNQHVLSLISNIIQNMSDRDQAIDLLNKNFVESLIKNVKSKNCLNQTIKLLALMTQNEKKNFRKELVEIDKNLSSLYDGFKDISQKPVDETSNNVNLKKLNETMISNSVLCMSHCVESDQNLSQRLTKTNIIMDLLYLTRDGYNAEMQKNCGILIAKLAKKDEKHLNRLRELNGIEILYAALKNANI